MTLIYADRVKEVASNKPNASTALNLPDTGATGYRSFDSVLATNDTCIYCAENGTEWEIGLGTFTAGSPDTLARTTVFASSNSNSAVDFSSGGDVSVFITVDASHMNYQARPGYFMARAGASTTQTFTRNTWTKATTCLDVEDADQGGWWDAANTKYTPTQAGVYLFVGSISWASIDSDQIVSVAIYKNGSAAQFGSLFYTTANGQYPLPVVTAILTADGDDYFELYCYHGDPVTNRANNAAAYSVAFSGFMVGRT